MNRLIAPQNLPPASPYFPAAIKPSTAPLRLISFLIRFLLLGTSCLIPAGARAATMEFNLPAQPADAALLAFSRQAKIEVLFSFDDLHQVRSTAVLGHFEVPEALTRLLQDTGFVARHNPQGKFVVLRAAVPPGAIKGRLLTLNGNAARGIRLALVETRQTVVTNASGEFEFTSVTPGSYQLVVSSTGYQPLHFTDVRVESNRVLTLEAKMLQRSDEPTRLEAVEVKGRSVQPRPFNQEEPPRARTATGNLDLHRTSNDALPYLIYDRDQIARSGVVNLNDFLQRELLESDAAALPPDQNGSLESFITGNDNLKLRGYAADETVVLINGRRLPEVLTSFSSLSDRLPPDVNFIPLNLVERVEVLPVSASALYSGNPVGGVINIVLRPDIDVTEVTTTYTNALGGFDAPQSSFSLQHGQTLLNGALRVRLSASSTRTTPATEAELGYIQANLQAPSDPTNSLRRATPNIRSVTGAPLFGPGTPAVTSVAPRADGTGGLTAFDGRAGVRSVALFDSPGERATTPDSLDYPYGRRQRGQSYFVSATYDVSPWLQVGLDTLFTQRVVNRGYTVFAADLRLQADSPLNPFGQDIDIALNETTPGLGENYSEARIDFSSTVLGLLLKMPADWRMSVDVQYGRNRTRYRGLAGVDLTRWQELVNQGVYQPLRDTQIHGPPPQFYDRALIYYGDRGRFVTLGDYQTVDLAVRAANPSLPLPTGIGALSVGGDYRRNQLKRFTDERRYGDGSLVSEPDRWTGRTLERLSVFGELRAPLLPARWLPRGLRQIEVDLAARYVAAATAQETNLAPTGGLKLDFAGGFSLRGAVATSNRFPTPHMSRGISARPGGGGGEISTVSILDPIRNQRYNVLATEVVNPNLRPEAAITRTLGAIFQRGEVHRFRAALDFADTQKTNELTLLDPQTVMNLESLLPGRVERAPLAPGDTSGAGVVTALFTGTMNIAWRHSQNWSAALDYAWLECLGGTLELHGRLTYFQRYDRQVLPDSAVVDELRQPDGNTGLLRYRANFGGGWSNRRFGFGLDGHYFHSRTLPALEWASQGGPRIDPYWQFDAYLQGDVGRWLPWKSDRYGLRAQARVNNVFDAGFPKYANDASNAGVQAYGDWRGRTYSLSLTITF